MGLLASGRWQLTWSLGRRPGGDPGRPLPL